MKNLRLAFILFLSAALGLPSAVVAHAKKKKLKKTQNSEDKYEDSKYLSKSEETGTTYHFDAQGRPVSQTEKKKLKKKKKKARRPKKPASETAAPAEKKKLAPLSSFNDKKPEEKNENPQNPPNGESPPPTGGSGITVAP